MCYCFLFGKQGWEQSNILWKKSVRSFLIDFFEELNLQITRIGFLNFNPFIFGIFGSYNQNKCRFFSLLKSLDQNIMRRNIFDNKLFARFIHSCIISLDMFTIISTKSIIMGMSHWHLKYWTCQCSSKKLGSNTAYSSVKT